MNDQITFVKLVLVYLLVFTSGSHVYKLASEKLLIIIFIVISFVWIIFSDRKLDIRFFLYTVIFTGLLLIISLYTSGSLGVVSIVGTLIKLILAYFIISLVGNRFVDAYIHVIAALAVFSLFGYVTDVFQLFDGVIRSLPRVGDIGYEGFLYVYRFRNHIDRNNSIFFEPGAYQIFLNAAIFMLLFLQTNIKKVLKISFILILCAALFTTFSTTGYLIFVAIISLFVLKSDAMSPIGKTALFGLTFMLLLSLFYEQIYAVIFDKIDRYLSIQHITDKKDLRSFDLLVDLEIIKQHIFGVGYDKYFDLVSAIGTTHSSHGSSNGISKTLAIYGLPFSLFFFSTYYWALRRLLGKGIISIVPFIALLMFFVGEAYYVFSPYTMAIITAAFLCEPIMSFKEMRFENRTI